MMDDLVGTEATAAETNVSAPPHWSTGENLPGLRAVYPTLRNWELQETYASDLRYINNWCLITTSRRLAWPASTALIQLFLRHHGVGGSMPNEIAAKLLKAGRHTPHASAATNRRRLATWRHAHRLMDLKDNFDKAGAAGFLAGTIMAIVENDEGDHPVDQDVIERLVETKTMPVHDLRDRAIIRLSFGAGALTRTEIAHITVEQLRGRLASGGQTAALRTSCLEAWLQFAAITDGPAFRIIGRGGNILTSPMSKESVYNVLKRRLEVAGFPAAWASFRPRRATLGSLDHKLQPSATQPTLPKLSANRRQLKTPL